MREFGAELSGPAAGMDGREKVLGDGGVKGDVSSGLWGFRDMLFAVPEKTGHTC